MSKDLITPIKPESSGFNNFLSTGLPALIDGYATIRSIKDGSRPDTVVTAQPAPPGQPSAYKTPGVIESLTREQWIMLAAAGGLTVVLIVLVARK